MTPFIQGVSPWLSDLALIVLLLYTASYYQSLPGIHYAAQAEGWIYFKTRIFLQGTDVKEIKIPHFFQNIFPCFSYYFFLHVPFSVSSSLLLFSILLFKNFYCLCFSFAALIFVLMS